MAGPGLWECGRLAGFGALGISGAFGLALSAQTPRILGIFVALAVRGCCAWTVCAACGLRRDPGSSAACGAAGSGASWAGGSGRPGCVGFVALGACGLQCSRCSAHGLDLQPFGLVGVHALPFEFERFRRIRGIFFWRVILEIGILEIGLFGNGMFWKSGLLGLFGPNSTLEAWKARTV